MAKKYNLLVVDDEEPLRQLLEAELSDAAEFAVDVAADGGEAINRIQAKVYDVILLDIRMPRVTGIEVLKFVQEYSPRRKSSFSPTTPTSRRRSRRSSSARTTSWRNRTTSRRSSTPSTELSNDVSFSSTTS